MQVDGVPLLKNYDTYQASFPVRELRNGSLLTLYQLPFYARITDLNTFSKRMGSELEMRNSVDYIAAASHSAKSASVLVGFLRSSKLNSGDVARLNFTHYLYMPVVTFTKKWTKPSLRVPVARAPTCGTPWVPFT